MAKKHAQRMDLLKQDKLEFTSQGFLKMPVFAGKVGVQEYFDENGDVLREFRPSEEVFSEKTMQSLTMIPITNDHPKKMVDTDNARLLTVGFTGEHAENIDNKFLKTTAVIFDEETIEEIRAGKVEVSLGYDVELEESPGEFDGEKYDVIQRNIVNNHLAIVDKGRAGSEVRLRLDSNCAVLRREGITIINKEDSNMAKVKIGDTEFELNEDVASKVQDLLNENEKLKKDAEGPSEEEKKKAEDEELEAKKKEEDEAEKKKEDEEKEKESNSDAKQAKIDALEADNKKLKESQMDDTRVDLLVRERSSVISVGTKVLDSETVAKMDNMDTQEIKKAIIESETETKMDKKSKEYIDARYDHIADTVDASDTAHVKMSDAVTHSREKATVTDSAQVRRDRMRTDSERWMKPVGKSSNKLAN